MSFRTRDLLSPHTVPVVLITKSTFDLGASNAKCFSVAIHLGKPRTWASNIQYLAGLEKTAAELKRTVRPSRRFDASVASCVDGILATVLVHPGWSGLPEEKFGRHLPMQS
jgi:hypothetical protein